MKALQALIVATVLSPITVAAQEPEVDYGWNIAADNEGLWNMSNGKGAWNGLLSVDADLSAWKGGSIEASAIASYGTGAVTNDIQGVSNLDAGENRVRLFRLGIGQQFGRWKLFFGLRNVDIDYFTTPYTSTFTGSSYGNFPTLSLNHPQATFPLSAMAFHVEYTPTDRIIVKESLYNGVASDRPREQFRIRPSADGFFNMGSVSYNIPSTDEAFSPASYMLIYSIASFPEEDKKRMHYTVSCNIEQPIVNIGGNAMLGILVQGGWNPTPGEEMCRAYMSLGAITEFRNGMTAGITSNRTYTLDGNESDIEFTFNYPFLRYFTVTPSLHCVLTDGNCCNIVGMLRLSFSIGQ